MLVVIFIELNEVLYGGPDYSTLQPRCARMRMAPLPRQNYRLLLSFVYIIIYKNRDGKGCSKWNRAKERASITVL